MHDKQKVNILNKDGIDNSGILSYTGVWDKNNLRYFVQIFFWHPFLVFPIVH